MIRRSNGDRNKSRSGLAPQKAMLAAGVTMVVLTMPAAQKAEAANANLNVRAIIANGLTLAPNINMNFGILASPAGAQTAVLSPDGVLTPSGTLAPLGGEAAGNLVVAANQSSDLKITVAAASATLSCTACAGTMKVNNFRFKKTGAGYIGGTSAPSFTAFQLTTGTVGDVDMGGTLNVTGGQAVGTYTGTVTVNLNYN